MKKIFSEVAIIIFLLCVNASAQTKQSNDEKAIEDLMSNALKMWQAGDMNKFAELLTEDCEHINPYGRRINGREAIRQHLQWVIDNVYPKGTPKLVISEYTVRLIRPGVALVTFLGTEENQSFREIVVVTKVKSEWKITSFQGVGVSEPPKVNPNQN